MTGPGTENPGGSTGGSSEARQASLEDAVRLWTAASERAIDRLLERLHQFGCTPERNPCLMLLECSATARHGSGNEISRAKHPLAGSSSLLLPFVESRTQVFPKA
jgi:hypothetical protein